VLIKEGADVNAVDEDEDTPLHLAAHRGQVEIAKVLIQNGADVNAVDGDKRTALQIAAIKRRIPYILQLLCFGAEIDEKAIKDDKTKLLRPIENRLKLLRDGNRMKTSLMSEEERRFMWNLACVLAMKHPAIALGTYRRIHAFVTFHGIFMGPGYGLGEESIWRK
jgi:ankyrin repeat protein